jgi:hypothetical protein
MTPIFLKMTVNSNGGLILSVSTTGSYTFTNTNGWFFSFYTACQWIFENGIIIRPGYNTANANTYDAVYGSLT